MTASAREAVIAGLTPLQYRRALGRIPTSAVVAGAMVDGHPVGFVVGTFCAVSIQPPLVGFFADRHSQTVDAVLSCAAWSFTLIDQDDLTTLQAFHRPGGRGYDGLDWKASDQGTPHISGGVLTIDAVPYEVASMGDRVAIFGRVVAVRTGDPLARPLVLHRGRLARVDPAELIDRDLWQFGWTD